MKHTLVIFLLLVSVSSFSQIGGENVYEFLNIPVSARQGALGGNVIAVKDNDAALSLFNPSLLTPKTSKALTFSYLNFFADVNQSYFSYVKDYGKLGTFSGGIRYVSYGNFTEADVAGNILGEFGAREYALIIGWGKAIDTSFSVGANIKPIYSSLYNNNSFGIAFDFSATYYNEKKEFTIATVVKNAGIQITKYTNQGDRGTLPFEVQVGISKRLKHIPFRLSIDATQLQNFGLAFNDSTAQTNLNTNLSDEEVSERNGTNIIDETFRHLVFGGEFLPSKSFLLRFGFNFRRRAELAIDDRPGLVGFSWGVGIRIKKFHISYGSARYHLAGSSNHFTITTNLGEYYKKNRRIKPSKKKE